MTELIDCNALTLTLSKKSVSTKTAIWALELENYDYTVSHRNGKYMSHIDALSRYPTLCSELKYEPKISVQENENKDHTVSVIDIDDIERSNVVIDGFTKFVILCSANKTTTKEVYACLTKYFENYNRPRRIVSDRGFCFTSLEFSEFLLCNNIEHVKIATASPQANVKVKRVNETNISMLAKISESMLHSDWWTISYLQRQSMQ